MGFADPLILSSKIRNALSRTDRPSSPDRDSIRHVNKRILKCQMILYLCARHWINFRYTPFLVSGSQDVDLHFS